jgi:plasmid stability protein
MADKHAKPTSPDTLKPITLRHLPAPLARAVRERAARYHISLNQAVIQLLDAAQGPEGTAPPPTYRDLDHLIGAWTRPQARAAERLLAEQRRIDQEMWQ